MPAPLLVYWIAFSYAHFLGEGIAGGSTSWLRGLRHSLADEFSIVENSLPPLVVLLLLAATGVPVDTAAWISHCSAVALMFGWGLLAAPFRPGQRRHRPDQRPGRALVIVLKGAMKALS